MSCDKN